MVTDKCVDNDGNLLPKGDEKRECRKEQRKALKKEFRALAKETCCNDDDQVEPEVLAQVTQREPELDCTSVTQDYTRRVQESCGRIGGRPLTRCAKRVYDSLTRRE